MSNRLFSDDPEKFGRELFKAHEETSRGIFGIFKVFAALWLVWVFIVLCALAGKNATARLVQIKNTRKPSKSKVKNPIKMTPTCRGFLRGEFTDANGQSCSLQRSSAFGGEGGELIWLGVNNAKGNFSVLGHDDLARLRNGGWGWQEKCLSVMFPDSDISIADRMHLNQEQVKALLPALQHFAKTGELPV